MDILKRESGKRWLAVPLYCWIKEVGSINNLEPTSYMRDKPTGCSIVDDVLERFFRIHKVKVKSAKFIDIVDRCITQYRTDYKFIRDDIKTLIRNRQEYNGYAFVTKHEEGYNIITAKQTKRRKKQDRERLIRIERSIRQETENQDIERQLFKDLITLDELIIKLKGFFTKRDILYFAKNKYMPYHEIGGSQVGYRYKEVISWIIKNASRYSSVGVDVHPSIIRFRSRVRKEAKHLIPDSLKDIINLTPMEIGYPSGVYFLCQDEKVVYVGQSVKPSSRIPHHYKDKKFNRVFLLPVPEQKLLQVEHKYIREFEPLYNKT
jgi:hypothetical protein